MIIIGDLHAKNKEPFNKSICQFFEWLLKKYKNEVIIQLGDLFDSASPHNLVIDSIVSYIKQFKEFHIIEGNHDTNYIRGGILTFLRHFDNVFIYENKTEIEIEGMKCLMLPYKKNTEEYEKINWKGNFLFAHLTNIEDQFGNEGVELKGIEAKHIYGHTHTFKDYKNGKLVLGVPLPTRCGEINNNILEIKNGKMIYIEHPIWFEYEDVIYPEMPRNKNNIINIKNSPSIQSCFEVYKDCHIREEGIELSLIIDGVENKIDFDTNNIKNRFDAFTKENEIDAELSKTCMSYL